jgi:hypothetical protein
MSYILKFFWKTDPWMSWMFSFIGLATCFGLKSSIIRPLHKTNSRCHKNGNGIRALQFILRLTDQFLWPGIAHESACYRNGIAK